MLLIIKVGSVCLSYNYVVVVADAVMVFVVICVIVASVQSKFIYYYIGSVCLSKSKVIVVVTVVVAVVSVFYVI